MSPRLGTRMLKPFLRRASRFVSKHGPVRVGHSTAWLAAVLVGLWALTQALVPGALSAQSGGPPASMRAYAHVFIAYAVAWLFVVAWILRIAARVKKVGSSTD